MRAAEPTDPKPGPAPPTPAERMAMYYATLRRRWRLAACIVGVGVLAGVVVGALSPKSYDATAKVLIGQRAQVDALLGAADYTPDPERDVNTSVELITLEPVAESARERLRLGLPAAALIGKVGTALDHNSNVVSITASDPSPERAARIANAFALAYRDFRARSARASIDDAITAAEERAAGLAPGPDRDAFDVELRRLRAAAAFQTGGVQIVRRATASSAVASRRVLTSAIVAGFLGVILAAVAIVVLARTDNRLRGESDLEAVVGGPVLATVPASDRSSGAWEACDALATLALWLVLRGPRSRDGKAGRRNGRSPSVLLLTSPGPGEGTSEVALGLADALADMGRRVILIEADLRDPSLAREFGFEPIGGLCAILGGTGALDDELVEFQPRTTGGAPVWALPAGAPSVLPQPLLANEAMASLVAEARRRADLVIIAGAPVGPFGDSLALCPLADAVLLVARLGVTRREEALRVMHAIDELCPPVLGAVATTGQPGRRRALDPELDAELAPVDVEPPEGANSVPASANGSPSKPEKTREVSRP